MSWKTSTTMMLRLMEHPNVLNAVIVGHQCVIASMPTNGVEVLFADNGRILNCGHELCFGWFLRPR